MDTEQSAPSSPDVPESIRTVLRSALVAAMKGRDREATQTCRVAFGAIESSALGLGAAEVARRALPEDEMVEIVRAEVADRRDGNRICGWRAGNDDWCPFPGSVGGEVTAFRFVPGRPERKGLFPIPVDPDGEVAVDGASGGFGAIGLNPDRHVEQIGDLGVRGANPFDDERACPGGDLDGAGGLM